MHVSGKFGVGVPAGPHESRADGGYANAFLAQFAVQAFNIFNHTQLGDPGTLSLTYTPGATPTNLTAPGSFGIITSTVNFNNNNDNKASPNTGTGLPRQLQFMLRFLF